ncbi:hypothetical protein MEA186_28957 [Mesorhizobium amorphae CCNWGS0123]|uniref:Uncharacterized protein n=1 Tax=Mesorhizobium amorphae CCNWGS0123 TaxID=1082933 RepID=G6YIG9_9HYPH|nr:hypothetical protein A6B35_32915 [Mesorhizobium amorphae CCNWGS0123]EHH06266.1 hypothetical protein MEA186_28957 [Mesorhizobium amorphae CCNWGS0123]
MDETNVAAPCGPQRDRVPLTVDVDPPWAELVWQEVDVLQDVYQDSRGGLRAVAPALAHNRPNIRHLLRGRWWPDERGLSGMARHIVMQSIRCGWTQINEGLKVAIEV